MSATKTYKITMNGRGDVAWRLSTPSAWDFMVIHSKDEKVFWVALMDLKCRLQMVHHRPFKSEAAARRARKTIMKSLGVKEEAKSVLNAIWENRDKKVRVARLRGGA